MKRIITALAATAAITLSVVAAPLAAEAEALCTTRKAADEVVVGMTYAEVEASLGLPARVVQVYDDGVRTGYDAYWAICKGKGSTALVRFGLDDVGYAVKVY